MIEIINTPIKEVKIIRPRIFSDERGYFFESYSDEEFNKWYKKLTNKKINFVQENESSSIYGVVRGLHFQAPPYAQDKLVRVVKGEVLDVAVDIRKGSPTYGKYVAEILSEDNHKQLFIPKGFAHGFSTLSEKVIFQYKCSEYYHPESEGGIAWDDAEIGIDWKIPKSDVILSAKDKSRTKLKNLDSPFDYENNNVFHEKYLVAFSTVSFHQTIITNVVCVNRNEELSQEYFGKKLKIDPDRIISWSLIKEKIV